MAESVGQRRKRAAVAESGTRVWVNSRREAEAPCEALTCAVCLDVFASVRARAGGRGGRTPRAAPRD
jgi:hypothetical protein